MKRLGVMFLWIGIFLLAAIPALHAQTTPAPTPASVTAPDLLEGAAPFAVTGNFAASSGNATNNGLSSTMEFRFSTHVYGRIDQFGLSNPSNTMISLVGIQGKWALSHLIKPSTYFNTNPIELALHGGPGIVKSPSGSVSVAGGVGFSVDYEISNLVFVRPIDVTWVYSRGLANNNIVLGSWTSIQTGLGLRF